MIRSKTSPPRRLGLNMIGPIGICALATFSNTATAQQDRPAEPAKSRSGKMADPPAIMSTQKYREKYLGETGPKNLQSGSTKLESPYKARFFGAEAPGQTFVFVIDNSSSMLDGGRLERAHREIRQSIAAMTWPQKFHVIAFDHQTLEMPGGPYFTAGSDKARRVGPWLASLSHGDDTRPAAALRMAIGLKPDAVFFLTDGEFENPAPDTIRKWNTAGVPLHVIDLGPATAAPALRKVAEESGGSYRQAR